ncbi:Hypp8584 [Branchiostoma lanceolatum]|nr:Hypp8584 [Branchiostoma lanceolatum]
MAEGARREYLVGNPCLEPRNVHFLGWSSDTALLPKESLPGRHVLKMKCIRRGDSNRLQPMGCREEFLLEKTCV